VRCQSLCPTSKPRIRSISACPNCRPWITLLSFLGAQPNEDDLEAAGEVYRKLKALAPQSDELIEVREPIEAAVIKRNHT